MQLLVDLRNFLYPYGMFIVDLTPEGCHHLLHMTLAMGTQFCRFIFFCHGWLHCFHLKVHRVRVLFVQRANFILLSRTKSYSCKLFFIWSEEGMQILSCTVIYFDFCGKIQIVVMWLWQWTKSQNAFAFSGYTDDDLIMVHRGREHNRLLKHGTRKTLSKCRTVIPGPHLFIKSKAVTGRNDILFQKIHSLRIPPVVENNTMKEQVFVYNVSPPEPGAIIWTSFWKVNQCGMPR